MTYVSNTFSAYNPFRYRGYYYDTETGFYYLNSRYYSPLWRRFISPETADALNPESINGLNLYAYAGNNPVNEYNATRFDICMSNNESVYKYDANYHSIYEKLIAKDAVLPDIMRFVTTSVKMIHNGISSMLVESQKWFDDFVEFILNNLTREDVGNISGEVVDAASNSSNYINNYKLYGGSGTNLKYTMYEEFGIDFLWD